MEGWNLLLVSRQLDMFYLPKNIPIFPTRPSFGAFALMLRKA